MHEFLVLASVRAVGDDFGMRLRRLIGSLALALAGVVCASSPHASAECASSRWAAHALTTLGASFPRTGGAILVAMDPDLTAGTLTSAEPPPMNVTRGRRTTWPLTPVSLAPGLYRVPFDAHMTRGIWTLHGLGADTQLTIGVAATPGVPVRPAIREARRVAATGIGSSGDRLEVRANLDFPVPDGVVASIVTWNTDASPGAWGRAAVGQREIVLYSERSACAALAPGWTPPPGGTLVVRVSWVDQYGQVSPPSDAITVQ